MASHKRSFQCFDAIGDHNPEKPSFPVGHRFGPPQRSPQSLTRLEPVEDSGCYLCADHQQAKPMTSEASGSQPSSWYHPQTQPHQHSQRRPRRPEEEPVEGTSHYQHQHHHRHSKRIVLVKNTDPSIQKTIVMHRRNVHSLGVFLDDVSELMQCLVRKLYTLEGHKIDSIQSLLQCPSILVCVGREPFHPLLLDSFQKSSDDKLPKLVLKSRPSACNDEQGCKNVNFGLETKKSIIHQRPYSNEKSARLTMSSEKSFPSGLNSIPPGRESMINDDIEKRVLINKDGSLSMEMKVRFRLLNDETLHWSTEIKKSSGTFNESYMGYHDAHYLQHSNSESCSEAESLSAGDADNAKFHHKHFEEHHCQHCCAKCQEYDIWKNPALGEQGPVRHIRSSSSSASSSKIVCKKASVDSMHTMSSEEYTEEVVEKSTCVQQTVGGEGDTTMEYCTISRCNRSELCSLSAKKTNIEEKHVKGEINLPFINNENKLQNVQTTHISQEERSVSVENKTSQDMASLNKNQDNEETDVPQSNSRALHHNNQEDNIKTKDVTLSPQSVKSSKSPVSPKHHLTPRPPSKDSGCSVKSRSRLYQKSKDMALVVEKETSECHISVETISHEKDVQDTATEERVISSTSALSNPENDIGDDTVEHADTQKKELSSSAMSIRSDASGKSGTSKVKVKAEQETDNPEERTASAMSSSSNISVRSSQSKLSEVEAKGTNEAEKQMEGRAQSAMSNTSTKSRQSRVSEVVAHEFAEAEERVPSAMSAISAKSKSSRISELEFSELKEWDNQIEDRPPSTMSIKSNASALSTKSDISEVTSLKPEETESQERVQSPMSNKSKVSTASKSLIKSKLTQGTAADPMEAGDTDLEERVPSAMSDKSHTSMKSDISTISETVPLVTCESSGERFKQKSERAMSHTSVGSGTSVVLAEEDSHSNEAREETIEERAPSTRSIKSNASAKSNKSKISSVTPEGIEEELEKRTSSAMSSKSAVSRSEIYKVSECKDLEEKTDSQKERVSSAMSSKSQASERCKDKSTEAAGDELEDFTDKTEDRVPSAMSTKSNTSTKTNKSRISEYVTDFADEEASVRSKSAMSSVSYVSTKEPVELESQTEERPLSTLSAKSNTSERSIKSKDSDNENKEERSPSAMTSISNVSARSAQSKSSELKHQIEQRPASEMSYKSNISGQSKKSNISNVEMEMLCAEQKDSSALSKKSNHSVKSKKSGTNEEHAERVASALSTKSNKSAKSDISVKSNKSKASEPALEKSEHGGEGQQERASSGLSSKTDVSVKSNSSKVSAVEQTVSEATSIKSVKTNEEETVEKASSAKSVSCSFCKKSERSFVAKAKNNSQSEIHEQHEERASVMSLKSNTSVKSEKSVISNAQSENVDSESHQPGERSQSALSLRSNTSARSVSSKVSETLGQGLTGQDKCERALSAMSCKSNVSTKSNKSKFSDTVGFKAAEGGNDLEERVSSTTSDKSFGSAKSKISGLSEEALNKTETIGVEEEEERAATAMSSCSLSARSNASARSKTSKISETCPVDHEDEDKEKTKRASSAASLKSNLSARSEKSKSSDIVTDNSRNIEDQTVTRTPSALSAKSNISVTSKKSRGSEMVFKAKTDEVVERSPSEMSAKSTSSVTSKRSKLSEVQQVGLEEQQLEKRAPSTVSIECDTSVKSNISTQRDSHVKVDPAKSENVEGMKVEERVPSPVPPKSNRSSRSTKSKSSALAIGQNNEYVDMNEKSASALSNVSVESNKSLNSERIGDKHEHCEYSEKSTPSLHSFSPASVKTHSSAKSKKSSASRIQAKVIVQEKLKVMGDMSAESNASIKSKSISDNENENENKLENTDMSDQRVKRPLSDKSQASDRCVCGGLKKSKPAVESSAKSKTSSVSSTTERDLTPASASVSIGIVEEYDVDNVEEEPSVSFTSTSKHGTQTPDEGPGISAGINVSDKSNKSEHFHSSPAVPTSDDVFGADDEIASNKSAAKNSVENIADILINTSSPVEQKSLISEEHSTSRASNVSYSKEKKPSSVTDRPKSTMSSASSHLEVKGHKSNRTAKNVNANDKSNRTTNLSERPAKKDDEVSRPRSADLYATSGNLLSPSPSKSPKRSKKPVILLGDSNDSVLSQSVSAPEPLSENSKNLNTAGDDSDNNVSDRACNDLQNVTDFSRDVSDKTSEKSCKCKNRKNSSSSQQRAEDETSVLVPSSLPNASPTEVVNEWLNKIPLDSNLYDVGDELHDNCEELERLNRLEEPIHTEKGNESERNADVAPLQPGIENEPQMTTEEMSNNEDKEEDIGQITEKGLEHSQSCSEKDDVSKSFHSSVHVMRVLLSPRLDRCSSLPEVSTAYGRKLSTSARGLLDCLVNLQLIDFDPNDVNGKAEKYKDLMSMLQSLWLCDPYDKMTVTQKRKSNDQQSIDDELKAKSSSGVEVSSGSAGSGKSSVNDSAQAQKSQTNTEAEGPETLTKVQEGDETEGEEGLEIVETKSDPATPDIASRVQWTPETEAEAIVEDRIKDSNIPASDDTIRSNDDQTEPLETPPSSTKSAGNEHQDDTSSGTPPSVQRAPLTKKVSQDPDPVWVLNLLSKIEKQFMAHYVNAMIEFKMRWNLGDNEQLDVMICELRDEVHKRIQTSINRELKKIHGRAGRPRPPKGAMSRESTAQTDQRRRRLKGMINQSIDPAAKSEDDYTATGTDFSDQRSDDEYCPCDTCMKKKMASRPVLPVEVLNSAPVMLDFDLRKILQLKREDLHEDVKEEDGENKSYLQHKAQSTEQDQNEPNSDPNQENTDSAKEHEAVESESENQDIKEEAAEFKTDKSTLAAEISTEHITNEQEYVREVDTADDDAEGQGETTVSETVEATKSEIVSEEKMTEEGSAGEVGVEDDEAEVETDAGEGEVSPEGKERPPEAADTEENETLEAEKEPEDAVVDVEMKKEGDSENAKSEPSKEHETTDSQIREEHEDADTETSEKDDTLEADLAGEEEDDGGKTATENESVQTSNAEIGDNEEEVEHEVEEEEESLKNGIEEEESPEAEKGQNAEGDSTGDEYITGIHGGESDDVEATKLEKAEEEDAGDETAEDNEMDKGEIVEEDGTADEIVEDIETGKAIKAEDGESVYGKTQEDGMTNDEPAEGEEGAKPEIARKDEMTKDGETSLDEHTGDNEAEKDKEVERGEYGEDIDREKAKVESVEDRDSFNDESPEDGETADHETAQVKETSKAYTAEDEKTADEETVDNGLEDEGTAGNETAEDEETSAAEIEEKGNPVANGTTEDEEVSGHETVEDGETAKTVTAEDAETADDATAAGETGNEVAADEETVVDEMAEEGRDYPETPKDVEPTDAITEEDGETTDDATAEDEENADDGTAEEGETADDGTEEEGETADDGIAGEGQTDDDGTAEEGETADDGIAEEGESADDGIAEEGETDGTAEEGETVVTAEEGETAGDGAAQEGVTAGDGRSEEEETVGDGTAEEGETEDDGTAEEGKTEDDGTAEEGETTSDGRAEEGERAVDETAEEGETVDDGTAEEGETADDGTAEEGETADDGTAEEGETVDNETVEEGETAGDGRAKDREIADDGAAEEGETADDGAAEEGETADDGAAEEGETVDDATAEEEETADDGTAEEGQTADDGTAEEGETADDGTAEERQTADDGTAKEGETADDGTAEEAETADDGTADEGETADDGTADEGETADDGTAEEGETADDGTAEEGETADDGTAEEGETVDDGTANEGATADDGTANEGATADDGTADEEETVDDGTANEGATADDGTADEEETADDGTAKEGETADDGTADEGETADDGTADEGETADDGTADEGSTADDGTAEEGEAANDGTVDEGEIDKTEIQKHEESVKDESVEKETTGEVEEINSESDESDTTEGEERQREKADVSIKEQIDSSDINSSIENMQIHDEVTELKADDEDDDEEDAPLKNEGDVVIHSIEEHASIEDSKEECTDNLKAEESSELLSDSQEKGYSGLLETDNMQEYLNGHMVNIGESAEGGDEAEDETDPDLETDEEGQERKLCAAHSAVWPLQDEDHTDENTVTSFNALVTLCAGSEDGADADVEDSESEFHNKYENTENEDEDNSTTEGRKHDFAHSPVEKKEHEGLAKLSDIAEDAEDEETSKLDAIAEDTDCREESANDCLIRQITKSSIESQPGSLEEVLEEEMESQKSPNHLTVKGNRMYPSTTSEEDSKDTQEKSDSESVDSPRKAAKKSSKKH